MGRKGILLLIILLLLSGCGTTPADKGTGEFEILTVENTDDLVSLTDVDFVLVPDETFYIFMQEMLSQDGRVFSRRFVEYNGEQRTIKEVVRDYDLPKHFLHISEAKEWLRHNAPARLTLYPQTYPTDSVLMQWEQEGYDYSLESVSLVPLETLRKLGAVSRSSEVFIIDHRPDELTEIIKDVEEALLPIHPNLSVRRESEIMQHSFAYRVDASLYTRPLRDRSPVNTETTVALFYRVDELGNPVQLTLETTFVTDAKTGIGLKPVINELAVFSWSMREALINELGLDGVNSNNTSLRYANITLHYQGENEGLHYSELYSIQ